MKTIGFIGLGNMGLPMAKRVLGGGFDLVVCGHKRLEPVQELKSSGAREMKTPKEVAGASDVTIAMLPDDLATGEVILGPNGVMEGVKQGAGIILMGTLSPNFCRKVADVGGEKQIEVLDSPVTGGSIRAETGELGIMVGGDKDCVEKYRPLLETMGSITYCGESGSGQTLKLASNMLLQLNVHSAYEVISWAIKSGADEGLLVELLKAGHSNSWVIQNWDFIKSINVDPPSPHHWLGAKDLDYVLKVGHEMGLPCQLTTMVRERASAGVLKLPEK